MNKTIISIDWTDTGCSMAVEGVQMACPVCGTIVESVHMCGDKQAKIIKTLNAPKKKAKK